MLIQHLIRTSSDFYDQLQKDQRNVPAASPRSPIPILLLSLPISAASPIRPYRDPEQKYLLLCLAVIEARTIPEPPALDNQGRELLNDQHGRELLDGPQAAGCAAAGLSCCYSPTW